MSMMALSMRHSPYTIPSPRFSSMAPSPSTYNPHFGSAGAGGSSHGIPPPVAAPPPAGPSTSYNLPSSSMLGLQSSMFSSMSPLATCGTTLQGNLNPGMNLLPTALNSSSSSIAVDSSGPVMGYLSDTSAPDHSPASCCSGDSPTSPPDLSVEDSPSPYKSCSVAGCYSSLSPPSSPGALPGSMLGGSGSPPPPSLPLAAGGSSSLPGCYPCTSAPSSILPSPMYSSQDYSSSSFSSFSSSMPSSFSNSSMPSLSMPMWSPYPSFPNVGPLSSPSLPKLSYDSPRYKLTPERAIPLIKWFEEHKEHPYPTRHEKILLCQSTQLTFTQVSTWFANARRRMKKALSEEEESSSQGSGSSSERENSPDCTQRNSNLTSSN